MTDRAREMAEKIAGKYAQFGLIQKCAAELTTALQSLMDEHAREVEHLRGGELRYLSLEEQSLMSKALRRSVVTLDEPAGNARPVDRSGVPPASPDGCTCHPADNPPRPCPRKFALSACEHEARVRAEAALAEARREGAEEMRERAARVADEHLHRVPGHNPDVERDDDIAQGYGNAALNIGVAIRALPAAPGEGK